MPNQGSEVDTPLVEFMNERMTPTEVLAAEVKQYFSGDGKQLLQTNLVGQTERARDVKQGGPKRPAILPVLIENGMLSDGAERSCVTHGGTSEGAGNR